METACGGRNCSSEVLRSLRGHSLIPVSVDPRIMMVSQNMASFTKWPLMSQPRFSLLGTHSPLRTSLSFVEYPAPGPCLYWLASFSVPKMPQVFEGASGHLPSNYLGTHCTEVEGRHSLESWHPSPVL